MNDIKTWLAETLKLRGWSQSELARRASVSQFAVSSVISGDRNAGADFCVKIAHALNESPEKVLRLAGILPTSPASEDDTLQELIELARSLPPEDQKEVLEYIRFRYHRRKS